MDQETTELKKGKPAGVQLVPLTPDQHAVTPIPKFTTELPFFYLTKQKHLLQQDVRYEGIDSFGNPVRWEVIPNRSPKIGVPSIEAHEIFTRLVKPTMELHRTPDGQIPEILPLGGVRECLRIIGWEAGGWEARRLLRGLMQIGQATCDSDFLLPVGTDANGKPLFRAIKGIFNRFSIYKIGSTHVSEDELASGTFKFDFDLDDTLYIQLHRIERDIQRNQEQRYLDNQYMFAIEARARRWYELLAAKIFGVVKNGGAYCEIKYSWYIKHHHTLTQMNSRSRIVSQMNRVIGDHLRSGFVAKVEYRAMKDEHGQSDFVIRYYPGKAAKDSVQRVLSFLGSSTLPILVARRRKRKEKALELVSRSRSAPNDAAGMLATKDGQEQMSEVVDDSSAGVDLQVLEALIKRDVMSSVAKNLLAGKSTDGLAQVQDYIDYWDSVRNEKHPGLLVSLIQNGDALPASFEGRRQREDRLSAENRRRNLKRIEHSLGIDYERYCRSAIDAFASQRFTADQLEARIRAREDQMLQEDVWAGMSRGLVDSLARRLVEGEVAKEADLMSADAFRHKELPRILMELGLKPAELGIELEQPITSEPGIAPDVQNDAPSIVSSENDVFPASGQNSSPGGV